MDSDKKSFLLQKQATDPDALAGAANIDNSFLGLRLGPGLRLGAWEGLRSWRVFSRYMG